MALFFRGNQARDEIINETKNPNVHLLVCDCSLGEEVHRAWSEFQAHRRSLISTDESAIVPLDGLICNAGALLNEKVVTSEGVETTFATHLLFGVYTLGQLAFPSLEAVRDSRLIVVSSGGMYTVPFPAWDDATSTGIKPYGSYQLFEI